MEKKIRFNKQNLDRIVPGEKTFCVYDDKTPGLELRVTPTGAKTFALRWYTGREAARIKLGRFPSMTCDQARDAVTKYNQHIAAGRDPRAPIRAGREELTLERFFDEYLRRHAKPYKKTWKNDVYMFQKYLAPLAKKRLSDIRPRDVQALHARLGREGAPAEVPPHETHTPVGPGAAKPRRPRKRRTASPGSPYQANRVLAMLRAIYAKAIAWGYTEGPNPCNGIKTFREVSRERFLQAEELPLFFKAVADEPSDTIRDFVLLSLLTGARRGNVMTMRWEDLRLDVPDPTWRMPDTKSGLPHTVPLVPRAAEILLARRQAHGESAWVFPGIGDTGHLVEIKSGWRRILQRAGLQNLRLHDLRRSLGSWEAQTGASLSIIGKSLAHKNVSTTAIYARLSVDPVRAAMNLATQAMFDAGKPAKKGKVIPISTRTAGRAKRA